MKRRTWLSVVASVLSVCMMAMVCLTACKETVTVTLNQTTASILVGETFKLEADVQGTEETVTWTSSDDTIATVRGGTVTGKSKGTAVITATVGEASATCNVTVTDVDVTMSQTEATVERGETLSLTATASDSGEISWSSSNPEVATVSNTGLVTAVSEGTATITARRGAAGSATCNVTVVWTSKPTDYVLIEAGDEPAAAANPGTWIYWADQGWVQTTVDVSVAEYANGAAKFTYSGNNGSWFGMQIFYKSPNTVVGTRYNLTCKITSAVSGDITINGTVVSLHEGVNDVSIYYTETAVNVNNVAAASLSIQCGVSASGSTIVDNTMSISDLKFTESAAIALTAPTALSIAADKTVSVTHANGDHATSFMLAFCNDAGVTVYEQAVANGAKLDDSTMQDGTYQVKVRAIGGGSYSDSEYSQILASYTVQNGGIVYDIPEGGEVIAAGNTGRYYYWTEFSGITNAKYDNGTITLSIVNGGNWYSNQLFYKDSTLREGTTYTLTFTVTSTAAGHIMVNGSVVELKAGENQVSVTYVQGGSVSLSIQFGVMDSGVDLTSADITISNLVWSAQ